MRYIKFFIAVLLFISSWTIAAQDEEDPCVQTYDKQVEKSFKKARELHKSGNKSEANAIYREILDEYPEHLEANYYLALSYYLPIELNQFYIDREQDVKEIIAAADRMYAVCPYHKIKIHLYAARVAYLTEDFASAIKHANVLIENPDLVKDLKDLDEAELIVRKSKFFDQLLNNPVPFNPKAVAGISTDKDEYLATISPDAEFFYFTRRQSVSQSGPFGAETVEKEFFSYSKQNAAGNYNPGEPLPYPFNESGGEGSPAINLANDLLIFSRMEEVKMKDTAEGGGEVIYPNYDLFYSTYNGEDWSTPQSLGDKINRRDSWESQPSLSSDGKFLFFASDRPGGYGKSDIWMSEQDANGNWKMPINLGTTINTKGNERSPFLHTDSKTLYFSSSGHDGMGGLDVFYSKMEENGKWHTPINIGYPINSENDEVDFFVSLDGTTAFFSSNNIDNKDWNIYSFELYEAARPHSMVIVKGKVTTDDQELVSAVVELRDTASHVIATTTVNENTGKYALATEIESTTKPNLIVNIKQDGYAYDTKLVTITENSHHIVTSDAEVKRIEVGKVCDLHDIYFGTNSFVLTEKSKRLIDLFVDFLLNNSTVKVEIQGHTDNVGNDNDNLELSDRRARSVYNYLIEKGIPKTRLQYKGYGESKPIADNNTESGRAKNRRTVFLILAQ